jgi:hypothetical protein
VVLADDDPEHPAMRVVAAEHAIFPSSTRLTFDLGPDDGSPFTSMCTSRARRRVDAVTGRAVLRAISCGAGYDRSMVVVHPRL